METNPNNTHAGLGERLGCSSIKISLPSEITTERCFIGLYCDFILAYQARARAMFKDNTITIPLGIMTSDDTHNNTVALLQANNNFGMAPGQLTVFKQEKVPAMLDNEARFAVEDNDPFMISTKPHGHGDVHMLLFRHPSKLVETWNKQGKKWVAFFQVSAAAAARQKFFPAVFRERGSKLA